MDKVFDVLGKITDFLGGGKKWKVGDVVIYLWPFVAFGIFLALIVAYDIFLA